MQGNYLKAVFWDHPDLCSPEAVMDALERARREGDAQTFRWIMARFLERGRVKDTARFFSPHEVRAQLKTLKISPVP